MESILEAINEWIKEILIGAINGNLSTMFGDVNEKVGTIAAEVGKTPQGWNANIFSMIQNLSENVIVPIAGLVITYVLCYELISMVTEKNNMHDMRKLYDERGNVYYGVDEDIRERLQARLMRAILTFRAE